MTTLPKTCDSKTHCLNHQMFDICDLLKKLKAWELGVYWPVRAAEDCFIVKCLKIKEEVLIH